MQQIAVYVISLPAATERRRSITGHLDQLGISFELVDGIDGRKLSPDERVRVCAPGTELTPGMIGCTLSHTLAWQRFIDSKRPVALILEDDARLAPEVATLVREGVDAEAFDICFLDCSDHNIHVAVFYDRDDALELAGGFRAHRLSAPPLACHAMLVTRDCALRRIGFMSPIRHCIDIYQSLPFEFRNYCVVRPKAAWLSAYSFVSATSPSGTSGGRPSSFMRRLRRSAIYHELRDWVRLKRPRRYLLAYLLTKDGHLKSGRRWLPLPLAQKVLD